MLCSWWGTLYLLISKGQNANVPMQNTNVPNHYKLYVPTHPFLGVTNSNAVHSSVLGLALEDRLQDYNKVYQSGSMFASKV